jgi:hypothetical protein
LSNLRPAITVRLEAYSKAQLPTERIDEEVRQLQGELRTLRINSIDPVSQPAPPGAKSGEAFTLGAFLLAVAPELLKDTLDILIDWLRRDSSRIIKISQTDDGPKYEVKGHWKAADLSEVMRALARQENSSRHLP